jgi:penicillin-binding protein 2
LDLSLLWSSPVFSTTARSNALDVPHTLHHARTGAPHLTVLTAIMPPAHAAAKPTNHATARHAAASARRGHARRASLTSHRHRFYERFTASSFASGDIFAGDVTAGEDPVVRQAAIDALGGMNGTAVVIDPSNGRILAMVNQKLALSPGAEPCSTIKITVAMARCLKAWSPATPWCSCPASA